MLVITNRPYIPEAEDNELFPNDLADFRKVSYLIAACEGQNNKLYFIPGFEEGMREINDGRDILLFIEGHGKTLPHGTEQGISGSGPLQSSMIVFDWPSKNRNFSSSLQESEGAGIILQSVIANKGIQKTFHV